MSESIGTAAALDITDPSIVFERESEIKLAAPPSERFLVAIGKDTVVPPGKLRSTGFYGRIGKRIFDVTLVTLTAPLWLPLYCLIALAILIFDGRPIHYVSTRPGRNLSSFNFRKFRTMVDGADRKLPELLKERPELAAEFVLHDKMASDPRITPLGRFLRRTSLDELPQLWHVVSGKMSLVGQRPPATEFAFDRYFGPSLGPAVFTCRPGLTGIWQISGRSSTRYERKVWLDLIYAHRCSLWVDIKILVQTPFHLLKGTGSS